MGKIVLPNSFVRVKYFHAALQESSGLKKK